MIVKSLGFWSQRTEKKGILQNIYTNHAILKVPETTPCPLVIQYSV